jgi:hypothetical protein
MSEQGPSHRRTNSPRTGRLLAFGTTGFATAVALLMVLSPVSAGAVHPATVLKAPYKGTTSSPAWYAGVSGCGTTKGTAGKWTPLTGGAAGSGSATAKTCGKSLGYVGGYNSGYWESALSVAIPFKVLTTSNHTLATSITVTAARSMAVTHGLCPTKIIHYPPALYSYESAGCQVGGSVYMEAYAQVMDLSNSSWYHYNFSYSFVENNSGWENFSSCYNYGTPTCSNVSGNFSYHYSYGYNSPGAMTCSLSGTCSFTLWSNSTAPMPKTDRWALELSFYVEVSAYADQSNVAGPFVGTSSASMNMATLGNGMKVNSVTIV